MNNFLKFIEGLEISRVAIDRCHLFLIYGVVTSHKPEKILELGIGSGACSKTLLHGIDYNQTGKLTCVDSWYDFGGNKPLVADEIRRLGAQIVAPVEEREFVAVNTKTERYDLIVSDGDHFNSDKWAAEIYDMLNPGGILFAHDVTNPMFENLATYIELAKSRAYSYLLFEKNSLTSERCNRGLLMVRA